jgi:hypothetical protein
MNNLFASFVPLRTSVQKLAYVLCSAAALPVLAQDFPTLQPKLQPQMELAATEFNAARANIEGRFVWPTGEGLAVPCQGALAALHLLGGAVKLDDEASKKQHARQAKRFGMLPGTLKPMETVVKRLHVVKAQCKNGKLDGDVEAWIEYDRIIDNPTMTITSSHRSHFKSQVRHDLPIYEYKILLASQQLSNNTVFKDAATQKMMAGNKIPSPGLTTFMSNSSTGAVIVILTTMGGKNKITTTVQENETLPPKLSATVNTYQRAQLISEMRIRDGELHGWMVMHPYSDMLTGVAIPGMKICYEEGEVIQSNTCAVD